MVTGVPAEVRDDMAAPPLPVPSQRMQMRTPLHAHRLDIAHARHEGVDEKIIIRVDIHVHTEQETHN